jgi:hypothetical protein
LAVHQPASPFASSAGGSWTVSRSPDRRIASPTATPVPTISAPPAMITARLGVTRQAVYLAIERGRLPAVETDLGRCVRGADLLAWEGREP